MTALLPKIARVVRALVAPSKFVVPKHAQFPAAFAHAQLHHLKIIRTQPHVIPQHAHRRHSVARRLRDCGHSAHHVSQSHRRLGCKRVFESLHVEVAPEAVGVTWGQVAADNNHQNRTKFTALVTEAVLKVAKVQKPAGDFDRTSVVFSEKDDDTLKFTPSTSASGSPKRFSLSDECTHRLADKTATASLNPERRMPRTLDLSLGMLSGATVDFKVVYNDSRTHCRLRKSATLESLFKSLAKDLKMEVKDLRLICNDKICFPSDNTVNAGIGDGATVVLSTD